MAPRRSRPATVVAARAASASASAVRVSASAVRLQHLVGLGGRRGPPSSLASNYPAYKDAQRGKPAEPAAALAHEQFHVDHGADEAPAYAHQLAVLQRLGAPWRVIDEVRRAATATR